VETEVLADDSAPEASISNLVPAPSPPQQQPPGGGDEEAETEDPSATPCCAPDGPTTDGLAQAHNSAEASCVVAAAEGPPGNVQPEATDPEPKPTSEVPKAPKVEEVPQRMTRNRAQMLASQSKQGIRTTRSNLLSVGKANSIPSQFCLKDILTLLPCVII
jgi:hypothetical protein